MNEPTQITLTNSLLSNQSTQPQANELTALPTHSVAAKNIQFSPNAVTLELFIEKHWQTVRLTTTTTFNHANKIDQAQVVLSADGKQLTITPQALTVTVNKPAHIQSLLNFITSGSELENNPLGVTIQQTEKSQINITKLNARLAVNNQIAALLNAEQPIQALLNVSNSGGKIDFINRFSDNLYTQSMSQEKLLQLLIKHIPTASLQKTAQQAILTVPTRESAVHLALDKPTLSQLPTQPTEVKLAQQRNVLVLTNKQASFTVPLTNSFAKPYTEMIKSQTSPSASPLQTATSPIKSWLQHSVADLKTRISDAVKYFAQTPFATTKTGNSPALPMGAINHKVIDTKLNTFDMLSTSAVSNTTNTTNTTNTVLNHQQFQQLPGLVQLSEKIKGAVSLWNSSSSTLSAMSSAPLATQIARTATPLQLQLISPLLYNQINESISAKPTPLSTQLHNISTQSIAQAPDLEKLVHHAFNRLISHQNIQPTTVARDILTTLQSSTFSQASFTHAIDSIALSILAAPIISQQPNLISLNNQTGVDALLQLLLPSFKTNKSKNALLEQLQQPQSQALASELVAAKNILSQVNSPALNQQTETNPLVQFLLPMKLPAEAQQTEITLGQYKKPSKDQREGKNVWFIRLNFDYAELGQLQAVAQLMDKAIDCQLLGSSQAITNLAQPHLDNLRSKLAQHGLQVGELSLTQGVAEHQDFYDSHAIINIKV